MIEERYHDVVPSNRRKEDHSINPTSFSCKTKLESPTIVLGFRVSERLSYGNVLGRQKPAVVGRNPGTRIGT